MSLPKKTSRKITVDGIDYRWSESVTFTDDGNCQINLTIESQVATTKRIYATSVCRADQSGDREKITLPKDVADVIQDAVANGWDPLTTDKDLHIAGDFGSRHEFFNEDLCDG
mgnify:FL=1